MKIYATLCTYNEADRYLVGVLRHLEDLVDGVAIFDDQSDDNTVLMARTFGPTRVRPPNCPPFLENEALFRQHAWWWLKEAFQPTVDDWILAIDADELVVCANARRELELFTMQNPGACGVFEVPEVWGFDDDGIPLVRVDGYWANITAARFCRWNYHSFDISVTRGGGSLPEHARRPAVKLPVARLLHFGYAQPADQQARYQRYTAEAGVHSSRHIKSIAEPPTLTRWTGPLPAPPTGAWA